MREFAATLARRVAPVPVRLVDERMTTVSAEAMLRDQGRKGGKRRAVVDQAAAVLILQHALDTERATGTAPGEILEETSMTDEYDADARATSPLIDGSPTGRRFVVRGWPPARRSRRRNLPGCIAVLVALAVVVGGLYFVVTWGIDKIGDQFSSAEDYPGPGSGKVTFEVDAGRHGRRDGPQPQGPPASWPRSRRSSTPRPPTPSRSSIQAGYFPLKKEMAAADVVEVLVDPEQHGEGHGHDPGGAPGRGHRRDPGEEDRLLEGRLREGARQARTSSGCPTTPRATPRATSSRPPTTSAPTRRPSRCCTAMVDRWKPGGRRRRPRGDGRGSSATRRRS